MPIYEYKCEKCGDEIELFQSINEKPAKKCERCGGKLKKMVSMSSFHLKGTGWYVTDYSRSGSTSSKSTGNKATISKDEKKSEPSSPPASDKSSSSDSGKTSTVKSCSSDKSSS